MPAKVMTAAIGAVRMNIRLERRGAVWKRGTGRDGVAESNEGSPPTQNSRNAKAHR
jgi:hypothetical protein